MKISNIIFLLLMIVSMTICNIDIYAMKLKRVFIVSSVNSDKKADQSSKFAKINDKIKLFCVIEVDIKNKIVYFTNADEIEISGIRLSKEGVRKWDDSIYGKINIKWYKVEPEMFHKNGNPNDPECAWFKWYTNSHIPQCSKNRGWIGFDKVEYKEKELKAKEDKWIIEADAHPMDSQYDINDGMGVMRYKVEISYLQDENRMKLSSAGKECTDVYGINKNVHMINFRRDDSFVGWLSSYFNVPGVFGSVKKQVDEYIGVDCADLIIAAHNKSSKDKMEYTNVKGLLGNVKILIKEVYLYDTGEMCKSSDGIKKPIDIKFNEDIMEGDIIFFDYYDDNARKCYSSFDHVGIIYKDKGIDGKEDGILNKYDLIMHAGFLEPHISTLHDEGFVGEKPTLISIGRFKR